MRIYVFQLVEKVCYAREAGFEIRFLSRLSRGKKHFYPHKCASDASLRSAYATRRCTYATRRLTPYATVRAVRMFLSEKSQDFFDRLVFFVLVKRLYKKIKIIFKHFISSFGVKAYRK